MDQDVLLKGVQFGLALDLLQVTCGSLAACGVLGTARFVVPQRLKKKPPQAGLTSALTMLQQILDQAETLEPTDEELALAGQLEYEAAKIGAAFDRGESQLCAMMIHRQLRFVLTGDKRAIAAVEQLAEAQCVPAAHVAGRFRCLEQAFVDLAKAIGMPALKARVCAERGADLALSGCFSCSSPEVGEDSWWEGLDSYVRDARRQAPTVLSE